MRKEQKFPEEAKIKVSKALKGRRVSMGTEFGKGHTPWNKGTKGLTKANKGSFKKGNIPANYNGGYKVSEDGIYVRVGERDYYDKDGKKYIIGKYEQLARKKYRETFGEFDKNLIIYHKDGDLLNNQIDNLELISRKELMKRNVENNSKKKNCIICGNEFLARVSYHKTCSEKCYKENCNNLSKKYYQENKEKVKAYKRKWKAEQRISQNLIIKN